LGAFHGLEIGLIYPVVYIKFVKKMYVTGRRRRGWRYNVSLYIYIF